MLLNPECDNNLVCNEYGVGVGCFAAGGEEEDFFVAFYFLPGKDCSQEPCSTLIVDGVPLECQPPNELDECLEDQCGGEAGRNNGMQCSARDHDMR